MSALPSESLVASSARDHSNASTDGTSTKSHQRQRIDMSAQLFAGLLEWRRQQRARWLKKGKPVPEWVFPSLEGTALEERNVRHVFTRMLEKADLRRICVHDLRHTFASLLLQQGESVVYVKEQLGHGSIQITVDTLRTPDPRCQSRRGRSPR